MIDSAGPDSPGPDSPARIDRQIMSEENLNNKISPAKNMCLKV